MKEDTRNHWKLDNLGRLSSAGIRRVAADPNYKGEAIYSADANSPTVRCLDGGGISVLISGWGN